jgi:predicted Rossmann fold nucleotide-binding protein DprA/Smf involved in DNA uptake
MDTIIIDPNHNDCPPKLRDVPAKPAFRKFWAIGNLGILEKDLFGILCSRRCPGEIILRAYDLAVDLRERGVPVVGGFQTPMEKEMLALLVKGKQPIVICPARGIVGMRIPTPLKQPLAEGRLLILSPFSSQKDRQTRDLADRRNRFVAHLADTLLVIHADPESQTDKLRRDLIQSGKKPLSPDSLKGPWL